MKLEKSLVTAILAVVVGMSSVSASAAYTELKYKIADDGTQSFALDSSENKSPQEPIGFDFIGSGTLKITNPTNALDGWLMPIIVATNGVATVDIMGTGFTNFTFMGGVVTPYSSDKKFKGKLKVVCDKELKSVKFGYNPGGFYSRPNPFDIAKLEIVRDGVVEDENYPVIFCDSFNLFRPPENYDWQIARKSLVTLASNISYPSCMKSVDALDDEVLKKFYTGNETDGYVLDMGPDGLDSDLYFFSPLRVKANTTVHFGGDHGFLEFMLSYDSWWNPAWAVSGESTRKKYPIECKLHFDGPDTEYRLCERNWGYVTNDVWGTGRLNFYYGGDANSAGANTVFAGRYALTGGVTNRVSSKCYNTAHFRNPDGYLGDAETKGRNVDLYMCNGLRWDFEDGLPHEVNLGRMTTAQFGNSVYAEPNTHITIADLEGCIRLESGTNNVHCAGATLAWYGGYAYYLKSSTGELPFSQLPGVPDRVLLEDGASVSSCFSSTIYEVADGANIELCDFTNIVHVAIPKDATVTVRDDAWAATLDSAMQLWLDASKPNTLTNFYNSKKEAMTYIATDIPGKASAVVNCIAAWLDCRPGVDKAFVNDEWIQSPDKNASFYPHVVPGMGNGLDALSFYLPSGKPHMDAIYIDGVKTTKEAGTVVRPKYMIMVFGSQKGGGAGIMDDSLTPKVFGRYKGLENSIVTNNSRNLKFWVDGKQVDPLIEKFSGGWQIISIDQSNYYGTFAGLGISGGVCGDQYYAEVLSFNRMLTDDERWTVERSLARKWRIGENYCGGAPKARINASGEGTIIAKTDIAITGGFEGTLRLEGGGNLNLTELEPPPPEEADLPGRRMLWFDADDTNSFLSVGKSGSGMACLTQWLSRDDFTVDATGQRKINDNAQVFYCSGSGRAPKIVRSARGKGAERNWLDFSEFDVAVEADHSGDALRLGTYPVDTSVKEAVPVDVKSVFVVQDSVRGGGSPVMTMMTGGATGSQFKERIESDEIRTMSAAEAAMMPVWRSGTKAMIGGSTYLDGVLVDGYKTGFSGAPQLLSALSAENTTFPFGTIGGYDPKDKAWNYIAKHPEVSETEKNRVKEFGEVIGEVIAYNRELSGDERMTVEGYLMWKWMGKVRDGFACLTNMTIAGSGDITVKAITDLPELTDDFGGNVRVTEQTVYDFTVNALQNPTEAVNVFKAGGKVTVPKECTIRLSVDSLHNDSEFTLIKAGSGLANTTWTLDKTLYGKIAGRVRRLELIVTDTEVRVRLWLSRGMIITYESVQEKE